MPDAAMPPDGDPTAVDDLRREIDAIDDALHDLLMRRADLAGRIGVAKAVRGHGPFIRPAREAEIVRRLLRRHRGPFPAAALVRVWRETMSALASLQGPLVVAAYAPRRGAGFLSLAREHYGSLAELAPYGTCAQVLRAVADGVATVGVLPLPTEDAGEEWWPGLMSMAERPPRVVTRLPFLAGAGRVDGDVGALAVALLDPEPTGDDISLLAIEAPAEASRGRLRDALDDAGLEARWVATSEQERGGGDRLHLVAVPDFVPADDPRLARFLARAGGHGALRIAVLGAFARPLDAAELGAVPIGAEEATA